MNQTQLAKRQERAATEPLVISQARRLDREYNSTYPAVRVWRLPNDRWSLDRYASPAAPMPDNKFNGGNRSRYMNREFDALIDRCFVTISRQDRMQLVGQIIHQMTDQVTLGNLFYSEDASLIASRLKGASAQTSSTTWNAEQWTVI